MPRPIKVEKLETEDDRAWMLVNDIFDVRIIRTDEGIVIDVFKYTGPDDVHFDPIATTYAFDAEATENEEEV